MLFRVDFRQPGTYQQTDRQSPDCPSLAKRNGRSTLSACETVSLPIWTRPETVIASGDIDVKNAGPVGPDPAGGAALSPSPFLL